MADFLGVDLKWHPDGWFYGVDGEYHPPGMMYKPGIEDEGKYLYYRSESHPFKIEGVVPPHVSPYGQPGSCLGVDGKRHSANQFYGLDGRYHKPDAYYDIVKGEYSDVDD